MKKQLLLAAILLLSFGSAYAAPVNDTTKKDTPPAQVVPVAPQQRVIFFWFTDAEAHDLFNAISGSTYPFNKVSPLIDKIQYQYQHQPVPPAAVQPARDTLHVTQNIKPAKKAIRKK